MLIRLISLVFLFTLFNTGIVFSVENNDFIYPLNKPSVFKKAKIIKNLPSKEIIPQKKPIDKKIDQEKIITKEKKINILKKKAVVTKENFIIPKNKPVTYKKTIYKAKKSKFLNEKDFNKAKDVFKLIKEKKWNTALKKTNSMKDKEFKILVNWMYLKQTGNRATFDDYQKFITKHSDYPRIGRLKFLAEHKILLKNTTPNSVIKWFEKNPPLSGVGNLKLAEAYIEKGNTENISELIKSGWVNAKLSKGDLKYYRNKYKKILSSEDHIKRADYLAWNNKYWDLKRMLRYLPNDEKALYNARQILMSNSYGVDKSIASVPSHLKKNAGLEYDRLKWRNRRGRLEQSLEVLYENGNKSEDDLVRADLWWKQRESITRSLIYKKRYKTAYKVASEHSLTSGPEFAEAEWLSGWIALSFLKSGEYAINHFENFYNNVSYPISLARGAYWLGRSYKSLGDKENSFKYFKEGSSFLTTYYGQLSFIEINEGKEFILKNNLDFSKEYEKNFNKNKLIRHIKLLHELDAIKYGKDIFKHLATVNIEEGSEILAAKLATEVERYDYAIQISKKASYEKRFYNLYNYPIISTPRVINKKSMPAPELILAIIRQESEFDRRANSYVGARGMMQLMKYTAKLVAKQAKLPYSISGLTRDPEYNIKLGSYYFSTLLDMYDGVFPFAIAAYNAGPNRVKTWKKINGNPANQEIDYINWIELIRFKETRNYVQRVLENGNVYKYMTNKSPVNINNYFK
jgi:soluble lytic murein transglycosylase